MRNSFIVGFIIRIYHDARSPERQMLIFSSKDTAELWGPTLHLINKYIELFSFGVEWMGANLSFQLVSRLRT